MQTTFQEWVADTLSYNSANPTVGKALRDSSKVILQWSNQETILEYPPTIDISKKTFAYDLPNGVRIMCVFMEDQLGVFWIYPQKSPA